MVILPYRIPLYLWLRFATLVATRCCRCCLRCPLVPEGCSSGCSTSHRMLRVFHCRRSLNASLSAFPLHGAYFSILLPEPEFRISTSILVQLYKKWETTSNYGAAGQLRASHCP